MAFERIFFEKGELRYTAQVAAYDDLIWRPGQLKGLLDDDHIRLAFQTDFVKYGTRLLRLFEMGKQLGQGTTKRTSTIMMAPVIFDDLLVPLLDDEFDSFADTDVLIRLVSTLIDFALHFDAKCRNDSLLLPRLAEKPKFLEILVSDEFGSAVFKAFCGKSFFYRSVPTVQKITRRLALLCASCTGGHGINNSLERWYDLVNVLEKLKEVRAVVEVEFIRSSRQNKVNPAGVLRRLSLNHGERTTRNRSATTINPATLKFPDAIASKLFALNIRLPTSERGLDDLIDTIMTSEIPSILKVLVETFPCRICHDQALTHPSGAASDKPSTFEESGYLQEEQEQFEGVINQSLFGAQAGIWKVLLSAQALKDLKHLTHAGRFSQVEAKLRCLSSGAWKNGNLSNLIGSQKQREKMRTQLLTAKCGKELQILWQIDVGYYEETASYKQLVKVWRVSGLDDVEKSIDRVVAVQRAQRFSPGSNEMRPQLDSSGIYIPRVFPSQETFTASVVPITSTSDRRAIELTNKFYALTKPVLDSLLTGNITTEFPFETSHEEVEIIKHHHTSTLILGRSGTGKTTCLVYQLLKKHIARRQILDEGPIRQVLVTRSNVLSEKLKIYTKRLIESQLNKRIWFDAEEESTNEYHGAIIEEDLDLRTFFDLPDEAFPLVCSFDQLLTMIGNTLADADRQHFHSQGPVSPTGMRLGRFVRRSQTVDFNLFKNEYWEQFNPDLRRGLSPQLVFSEIMGVIKGGASKETSFCPLSRSQYLNRSCRLAPTFTTESGRECAYNLYEAYEKKKASLGDIDGIDRVLGYIRQLDADVVTRRKVERLLEEIYVDEIQDQRCLEIVLLLNLVRNPRGIHFAGDTAQCISKDSTFRFQDIKSLFFETFDPIVRASNETHLSVPKLFTLTKNYRSHQGIISLASSVMKMLYTIFPNTVDKLPPEQGQNDGPKPVFFVGFDEGLIADSMVGLNKANETISDFGSEQVILVRDDSRKFYLQDALQNKAVVLTILESKGMEFEDVLLYEFFTDSPCKAGYRSLQKSLGGDGKVFDTVKHAEICSELKNLYVAITRPRARLWIVESSVGSSEPLIEIFTQHDLEPFVTICTPSDPDVAEKKEQLRAATTTDPIRFIERGNELLQRGLYKEALIRFKSGNDQRGQTIAKAFIYREEGIKARGSRNEAGFVESFENALAYFLEAKLMQNVASCLEELNRFCESGDVHFGMGIGHYARAAELYIKGEDYVKASHAYNILGEYDLSASILLRGEEFDRFAKYLAVNRQKLDPKKVKDYSRLVNMLLKQGKISPDLQDLTIAALGTDEEKVKFFKTAGLTQQLANHYESKSDFENAWKTLRGEGGLEAALNLLTRAKKANHTFSTTDKFRQACINLVPYAKARECKRRFPGNGSLSEDGVQYTYLHPEARLLASHWGSFIEFVESAKSTKLDTTPWNFDDTHNILYVMNIQDLDLINAAQSMQDLEIFINAIRRIPQKLQGINADTELPEFFRVVMGFLPCQNTLEELIILDYSPLSGKLPRCCDTAEAIALGVESIAHQLLQLAGEIDQKANSMWSSQWPWLCPHYVVFGVCRRDQCPNKHCQVTSSEYKLKIKVDSSFTAVNKIIQSLIEMTSLFSSLRTLYQQHGPLQSVGNPFFSATRRWLERELKELTFVSPFEHDPSYMKEIREMITKGQGYYRYIRASLEDMLLLRLKTEWENRNTLSSWLDQLQLAEWLGPQTEYRFKKAAGYRIWVERKYNYNRIVQLKTMNQSVEVMYGLGFCRRAVNDTGVAPVAFENELKRTCSLLIGLFDYQYMNFYAVSSAFEFLAAYLICMLCRGNGYLLFPKSWITLHLPKLNTDRAKTLNIADHDILKRCFLLLIDTFTEIILYLEERLILKSFTYKFSSSTGKNISYMLSLRNAHFLFICSLNILAMEIPPRGFRSILEKIYKTLKLPAHFTGQPVNDNDITTLAQALHKSFTNPSSGIKGKDSLMLLSTTTKKMPNILSVLRGYQPETPVLEMKSVITAFTPGWTPTSSTQASGDDAGSTYLSGDDASSTYSPGEEAAVFIIQQWWRLRHPLLLFRRNFLQTDEGKATQFVNSNIIASPAFDKLSSSWRIKLVLRTQGVTVYTAFRRLMNRLKLCLNRANKFSEDSSTSIQDMERLQTIIHEELDQYQSDVDNAYRSITPKKLLSVFNEVDMRPEGGGVEAVLKTLDSMMASASSVAKIVEESLANLDNELEKKTAKRTARGRGPPSGD